MRTARRLVTVMGGGQTYAQRVLALSPYAYWPLNEAAGATQALDAAGTFHSSAVANVTFGADGIGDGNTAASFNGVNSLITLPHASMTATLPVNEGSMALWVKIAAAVWIDGQNRTAFYLEGVDNTNLLTLEKRTTNAHLYNRKANNVNKAQELAYSGTDWYLFAFTWSVSGGAVKAFVNGVQIGVTQTSPASWASDPKCSRAYIGNSSGKPFSGLLAHAMLFSRVLTTDELLDLASF